MCSKESLLYVSCSLSVLHYELCFKPLILCLTGSEGSNLTPAHHYGDFRFKTYAPVAFRYFREMFGIRPDDYMVFFLLCIGENVKGRESGNCDSRRVTEEMEIVKLGKWKL